MVKHRKFSHVFCFQRPSFWAVSSEVNLNVAVCTRPLIDGRMPRRRQRYLKLVNANPAKTFHPTTWRYNCTSNWVCAPLIFRLREQFNRAIFCNLEGQTETRTKHTSIRRLEENLHRSSLSTTKRLYIFSFRLLTFPANLNVSISKKYKVVSYYHLNEQFKKGNKGATGMNTCRDQLRWMVTPRTGSATAVPTHRTG